MTENELEIVDSAIRHDVDLEWMHANENGGILFKVSGLSGYYAFGESTTRERTLDNIDFSFECIADDIRHLLK